MALSKATVKNVIFFIVLLEILLQRTQGQSSCAGKTGRFINGTCYTFYDEFVTWQQAKIRCEARGKVLSSVDSKMQIKEMVTGQNIRTQVWIGASDIAKEGTFVWVHNNKTAVELLSIWNQNEPNDFGSNEDCVVIINTETNDAPCYFNFTYFCMETPKTDIITTTVSITSRKTTTPLSTVKTTTDIITTTVSITSRTTTTPLSTVKTTTNVITTTTESIKSMNTITPVSTMKNSTEVEEPLLSQQNIYIISAASIGLLLLVLAIASIVVCRRKVKRKEAFNRSHVYNSLTYQRHDTVTYSSAGYAVFNAELTLNKKDSPVSMDENAYAELTLNKKDSPVSMDENAYAYIGGETPTEEHRSFK